MKKQKQEQTHKSVLYYTIQLRWLKGRQQKARTKLLKAISQCTKRKDLRKVLLFGSFLQDDPQVQDTYCKRLSTLEQKRA